jgi:hypothetical protein
MENFVENSLAFAKTVASVADLNDPDLITVYDVQDSIQPNLRAKEEKLTTSGIIVNYKITFIVQHFGNLTQGYNKITAQISNSITSNAFTTALQANAPINSALT